MEEEGANFNPDEINPFAIAAKEAAKRETEIEQAINAMTPMHFESGGAGNNFLGISPIKNKEEQRDGSSSSKKIKGTPVSVSYQAHQWGMH